MTESVKYISPKDVCALVPGMTEAKLTQLRFHRKGPAFLKPTLKTVIYRETDVIEWIESTAVTTGVAS